MRYDSFIRIWSWPKLSFDTFKKNGHLQIEITSWKIDILRSTSIHLKDNWPIFPAVFCSIQKACSESLNDFLKFSWEILVTILKKWTFLNSNLCMKNEATKTKNIFPERILIILDANFFWLQNIHYLNLCNFLNIENSKKYNMAKISFILDTTWDISQSD
jgi:hypothetical protein